MMKKWFLIGMLVTAVIFMVSGLGFAAAGDQLPIQLNKKPVKTPVKVSSPTPSFTTARPLVTEIKVSPARINTSAIVLTVPYEELRKAMEHVKGAYFGWDYINGVTDWLQQNCSGKSYTVDEQKAAGCLGTDTVDACTEKLYQHCFQSSPYMNTYKRELREMIEAMDALNKAAALYENGLKQAEKKVQQP
ncbi:MAG: hypothetical protein L6301_00565 [Desulfobacteraceae bacterium]|nr:hypothetical protein [Desulfobacteraceae bacterium]